MNLLLQGILFLSTVNVSNVELPRPCGAAPCRYYAYIMYGEAKLVKDFKKSERVYKEVAVFRNEEGFKACCNDYCSPKCAGFTMVNIGPFETEVVAYAELTRVRTRIEADGYKPYDQTRHMMIGHLQFGLKKCP